MNNHTPLKRSSDRCTRKGVVSVEAAIIMPVLIFITVGAIDVGQFINLAQMVSNSSREGARIASRDVTESTDEVESAVIGYFQSAFPGLEKELIEDAVDISITTLDGQPVPGGNLAKLPSGTGLSVRVQLDFAAVRWIGGPDYFEEGFRSTETICKRE